MTANTSHHRLLLPAALVAASAVLGGGALGDPAVSAAAPSDPTTPGGWDQQYYDWCMAWASFESDKLKCCADAGGSKVPTGPDRGDTVCVAEGGAGPAPGGGGAGPAPAGTGPRAPGVTPPDDAATQGPPSMTIFAPAPANAG